MIKLHLLVFCLLANAVFSQTANYTKAPNSYIYDLDQARENNFGGLIIPVKKAYEMWAKYPYLKTNGNATPIPAGVQSASIYWEDVPGLVREVSLVSAGDASDSNIKVKIDQGKGKGNAVIAFKVDGTIYWSWHIWVTDNPENGVTYGHGTETDVDGNPIAIQYMDRNLGATANGIIDHDWQKTGGLMYEWGRKDPFPPLVYKDADFYSISGEVGNLRHPEIDAVNTIPVVVRPFDEIEKNMQYAVKNPIKYIVNTDSGGNWFSSSRYKVPGASPNYVTWDLWSDNAKGANGNGNSSSQTLSSESRSYELKSELDPCPSGWRIPSYYGRETQNNNLAFFGKKGDWNNADTNINNRQLFPDAVNPHLNGIKVYPGIGMDFTNAEAGNRNIGQLPLPGAYVYYPNSVAPNAPVGVMFQDNAANGGWWSSTFGFDGARLFSMISDPERTNTTVGLHAIFNNQTNPTRTGNAVRCMRDPNLAKIGHFATQYFTADKENYTKGIDNPNSYIVVGQSELLIPVNKAFAVHNQLLSDQEMPRADRLVASVVWSSSPNLIKKVSVNVDGNDPRDSKIEILLDPDYTGNAVVALHNGSKKDPVLWSWHIWAPGDDPTAYPTTYTTEQPVPVTYNFVNATASKHPPLTTVFMDRNLGALYHDIDSGMSNGLHYQWGRKDPIPTPGAGLRRRVYLGIPTSGAHLTDSPVRTDTYYHELSESAYDSEFTTSYSAYGSQTADPGKKIQENIRYSVENPFRFLYHVGMGAPFDGGDKYQNDLNQIRDWVSDDAAQASNRWGHGGKKSPFDPCPEGWRVPDVSSTNLYTGSKGTSPWYNGYRADAYGKSGVIQDQWHSIAQYYGGETLSQKGWKFEDPAYNIGQFPMDGIRGELGEYKVKTTRSGLWTASMADLNTGFALAMLFQNDKVQTGTGVYPQAGLSVRCAKDEKRLLGTPAQPNKPSVARPVVIPREMPETRSEVHITPNPFQTEFALHNADGSSYEIYDFSGKLVQTGVTANGRVAAANLPAGVYVIKITMKDGVVVSKKLIKN